MGHQWAIRTDVSRFVLPVDASLPEVAGAMAAGRVNTVFGIDADGKCVGSFSRGDLIRRVAANQTIDAHIDWNTGFERLQLGDDPGKHLPIFSRQLGNVIPVLDRANQCRKILERVDQLSLTIGNNTFIPRKKVCVIAEIGNNHNGDVNRARALIEAAASAGAHAVKFQARVLDQLYKNLSESYLRETDYATAYTVRQLKRFNLALDDLAGLMDFARQKGLLAICTAFDQASMCWLLDYGPDAIKIASSDLSNIALHKLLADTSLPVLMSTGMNTMESVERVAAWFRRNYVDCSLLHTNSTYPTPVEDINLNLLDVLAELSPSGLVGYSGHERGIHIPLIAASMGAVVIEKHFTLDRGMEGNDHKVSLLPDELAMLCSQIEDLTSASGSTGSNHRAVSQGEVLNSLALEKGVYARHDIEEGEIISETRVEFRSPRTGISPLEFEQLRDRPVLRGISQGHAIVQSDFLEGSDFHSSEASGLGQYGVPVRMRDCQEIWRDFSPSFVEYHLFSTDLEIEPGQHKIKLAGLEFSFHAPEQFDDGFVLDLVSDDRDIRRRSEELLERCVQWCLKVAALSGQTRRPTLVVNVGGATNNRAEVADFNRDQALEIVAGLVMHYKAQGIDLLPQTMPPFPWHFGGQGFHRLFVDLNDVVDIQQHSPVRVCLDVSHTFLACDFLGKDFYKELSRIEAHIGYCHVSDSAPPNGEGLQIGVGVTDFKRLDAILGLTRGERPWVPEIWNGHLNGFSGFAQALNGLASLWGGTGNR